MEFFNINYRDTNMIVGGFVVDLPKNEEHGLTARKALKLVKNNGGWAKRNGFRNWSVYYN